MPASRLTVHDRLCLLLDLDRRDVGSCLAQGPTAAHRIAPDVPLEFEEVERLLAAPETAAELRVDPNTLRPGQWRRLSEFEEVAGRPPRGRPFYSLEEVSDATGLSVATARSLFTLPELSWTDKPLGRTRNHRAATDRYVVEGDVERSLLRAAGFAPVRPAPGERGHTQVVEARAFEAPTDVDALKSELPGAVHPVLIDGQGFRRHLAPGLVDAWVRDVEPRQVREVLARSGLTVHRANEQLGHYVVALADRPPDGDVTRAVIAATQTLNAHPDVRFAEPYQFDPEPLAAPDVPVTVDEFEAGDRDWNTAAIRLPEAHTVTTGSRAVTIFVVDSGAWMDHPDLVGRYRDDWVDLDLHYALDAPPAHVSPDERVIAHGTKVLGVVAGANAIAPGCRVLPVKISGSSGGVDQPGYALRAEAILAAVSYLREGQRGVLNLSWRTNGEIISIREALRVAADAGFVICASAGNYHGGEPQQPDALHYPSGHAWLEPRNPAIVSVGALAPDGRKASYSYYGTDSVTLMAPGGERGESGSAVFTTSTPSRYTFTYGTSFAAPHAAGVAALVLSAAPELTAAEVVARLRGAAADLDGLDPTHAGLLGAGRLDAAAALAGLSPTEPAGDRADGAPSVVEGSSPVGERGEQPDVGAGRAGASGGARVDLTSADLAVLAAVAGIGWWRARGIVRHRDTYGPFLTVDDLLLTGLFTPARVHALRPFVTVG